MERAKPNRTKKARRSGRKRRGQNAPDVMMIHRAPRYLPLCDKHRVALDYASTRTLTGILAFTQDRIDLFDVGSKVPKYWNQLFALYRYAFIQGVEVTVEISNTAANAGTVCLAESNSTDFGTNTMVRLTDTPRSKWSQCIPAGNHSVITLKYTTSGEAQIGRKVQQDVNYWTQIATPPSVAFLPLLAVGYEPATIGLPFTGIYTLRVRYHISYFTLNPQ